MGKIIFFVVVVTFGVVWGLIFLNQKQSPTLSTLTPTPFQNTGPALNDQTPGATSSATQSANMNDLNEPLAASISATIKTSKGEIVLTLFGKEAPYTVLNFVQKAKSGFYKNLTIHRVEDWVIQGGDPKGDGTGGGQIKTELNNQPFVIGSLGVARGPDINISNDAQFFITKTEASWLNGQYTNFGIVTRGMDIVNQIKSGDKILDALIDESAQ